MEKPKWDPRKNSGRERGGAIAFNKLCLAQHHHTDWGQKKKKSTKLPSGKKSRGEMSVAMERGRKRRSNGV